MKGDVFRWWCLEGGRWDRDVEWKVERRQEVEKKCERIRDFMRGKGAGGEGEGGWEVVEEFEAIRDAEIGNGSWHDSTKVTKAAYRVVKAWGRGEVKGLAWRRGRREIVEYLRRSGFGEWIVGKGEEGGKGKELVEEVLREFRDDMRDVSVKALKGGEMVDPKEVLEVCDRVRDDERLKEAGVGGGDGKAGTTLE